MKFRTTAAYVSGAICGDTWMPQVLAGFPVQFDLRSYDGFGCFSDPKGTTFEDVFSHYLSRHGGYFQNPLFSEDSEIVIERRRNDGPGKYTVHVKRIPLADLAPDYVREGTLACDFFGDSE